MTACPLWELSLLDCIRMHCNLHAKPNGKLRSTLKLKEKDLANVTYVTLSDQAMGHDEF
jgi:hypothetical protein